MTTKTTIEWTHQPGFEGASWNPTVGCTRVSAGCDNCYAFALHDKRYASNLKAAKDIVGRRTLSEGLTATLSPQEIARQLFEPLPWPRQYDLPFSRVQLLKDRLDVPLRTRKPTCYFVDSMADLFHQDVPDEFIDRVFLTMSFATWHRFLVLTKRPERMRAYMDAARITKREYLPEGWAKAHLRYIDGTDLGRIMAGESPYAYPLPNVWLGTSVEDQRAADERIPHLLATPAAVRFLSCEPLLGPVDLGGYLERQVLTKGDGGRKGFTWTEGGIDWVIAGGESGPRARPMDLAWLDALVQQCRDAGVPVFVKQDNGPKPGMKGRITDDLWLKEFPDGR